MKIEKATNHKINVSKALAPTKLKNWQCYLWKLATLQWGGYTILVSFSETYLSNNCSIMVIQLRFDEKCVFYTTLWAKKQVIGKFTAVCSIIFPQLQMFLINGRTHLLILKQRVKHCFSVNKHHSWKRNICLRYT